MPKRITVQGRRRNHLPLRLNLMFFIVFLLFAILIFRLGVVQIVNGEQIAREVQKTELIASKYEVPRGKIYDRDGRLLVDTISKYSIVYRRSQTTKLEERLEVASRLAKIIELPKDDWKVTERDKKDYWIAVNKDESDERYRKAADAKYSLEQQAELTTSEEDQIRLDTITEEDIDFDDETLELIAIKHNMEVGYALDPQLVKVGASPEEMAIIDENLEDLPGVTVEPFYERSYPYKETLRGLFGKYAQIPAEQQAEFKAKGYSMNDRVGNSFLEQQYEQLLRGKPAYDVYTTFNGQPIGEPTREEGEAGKDLVLTVDAKYQQQVDQILRQAIKMGRGMGSRYLKEGYAVVMNPKTGEILAMSGQKLDTSTNKFSDVAINNVLTSLQIGSTIKGATVAAGLQTGVIEQNEVIMDAPVTIGGMTKKSYVNMGAITDLKALERSSNVYMFQIALRLSKYSQTGPISPNVDKAAALMQNYYSQFGLGVTTGVDLPYEAKGVQGIPDRVTLLMDRVIGQYDAFTPLQVAQYISTLANGGYRVQPHFLKEVRTANSTEESMKKVEYSFETNYLNRVNIDQDHIDHVREGLHRVVKGDQGTARIIAQTGIDAAAKTGTAQVSVYGEDGLALRNGKEPVRSLNSNLVGWAPYDNPEMAWAVFLPYMEQEAVNSRIGHDLIKAYFDVKDIPWQTKGQ
ncbi:peptidoglycan D,D-transpeptidase FtsI family protein [Exiguobacterium flavidum]|uniref:peptidoglycan D,D-transpeptidase FtsI family protein n=1 Tax=Exiguobacterium flavidum TaxID=2184695 RepID=UPI000DF724A4|nr:penicillin-binding protein 2 [Exiguobacterium flavidum]